MNRSIVYTRRGETYIFVFENTDAGRAELAKCFGRFARNEELPFSWQDAANCVSLMRAVGLVKGV